MGSSETPAPSSDSEAEGWSHDDLHWPWVNWKWQKWYVLKSSWWWNMSVWIWPENKVECLSSGKRYHVLDQRSTTGGPLSRPCCLCSSTLIGWFIPKGQNVNTEFYKTLCFCSTVIDIALSSATSTMNAPCLQVCHHKQIFGEKHSIAPTPTILSWPYSKSLFVPTTLESNEISLIWLNWSDSSQCNERSQIWWNWRDSS